MEFAGFDWDAGNIEKCQKHGVSMGEIESLFRGTPLVDPDAAHSLAERRFRAIGKTSGSRSVFVVFTWRLRMGERLLRPISARYMHEAEVAAYEEKVSGTGH